MDINLWLRILCAGLVVIVSACAPVRVPQAAGPVDEPRASWSIRAGERLKEREICRSDMDQPCVIGGGSTNQPTSVVVSVYLHPVGNAKTTYQGALSATFMTGANGAPYERQVDMTIEPGRRPTAMSVAGRMNVGPGRYYLNMALMAMVPNHSDPFEFQENIPIVVTNS
jgi:hypothetical protein